MPRAASWGAAPHRSARSCSAGITSRGQLPSAQIGASKASCQRGAHKWHGEKEALGGGEGFPEYSKEHANWPVIGYKKRWVGGETHLPKSLAMLTNAAGRRKQPVPGTGRDFWGCSQASPPLRGTAQLSPGAAAEVRPCSHLGNLLLFYPRHPTQAVFLCKLPFLWDLEMLSLPATMTSC